MAKNSESGFIEDGDSEDGKPTLCQVTTTLSTQEAAIEMADKLVSSSLAACVQISGPVTSVYRWQGELKQEKEWLVVVKTPASSVPDLVSTIQSLHSYEVPEILVTDVLYAPADYIGWAMEQTQRHGA